MTKRIRNLLSVGVIVAAAAAIGPVSAQTIYYDQGNYNIYTDLGERFLGRYGDGTPLPSGTTLLYSDFRANPAVGGDWTSEIRDHDVWEARFTADPGLQISALTFQPVWSSWLDYYNSLLGYSLIEVFADAAFTSLMGSEQIDISWYTQGPHNLNEFGVYYLHPAVTAQESIFVRVTTDFWGRGCCRSSGSAYKFHLWADVSDAPIVTTPVPEPETYAMLLAGLGLLGFASRRRKLKEAAPA